MSQSAPHIPVMLEEVVAALSPAPGDTVIDATFGAGGYTRAILAAAPDVKVVGIDRDPAAILRGAPLLEEFGARLKLVKSCFGNMKSALGAQEKFAGAVFDLGVSSPQIDEAGRGFSFRFDGPLDMRMSDDGPTAAEVVNTLDEESLAGIISSLGEERHARRVARALVAARAEREIATTFGLAEIVRRVVPRSNDGIDAATRTFQALRIYVNDELGELERGLAAAEQLLMPGGRLVVVAFHSLEDRIVKHFLRARAGSAPSGSRHLPPLAANDDAPSFTLPDTARQPLAPSPEECARNGRAASARLRFAIRTSAPAWSLASEPVSFPSVNQAFPSSQRGRP